MSSSTTPQPQSEPTGTPSNVVQVEGAPRFTLDEQLQLIWAKHSKTIIAGCVVLILVLVGIEATKQILLSREKSIGVEFGAADTTEKLRSFANEHSGHQLAGVAWLKIADEAYTAGRYAEAAKNYEAAQPLIAKLPFAGRALLGLGMSQAGAGEKSKGEATLRRLADDAAQPKSLRAEARYNLAVLANEAGKVDEARKLCDETTALDDQGGVWSQRALLFKMSLAPAKS